MASRTLGWVQDASKIENLRKTVEVFNHESLTYQTLIENRIPMLVEEQNGRDRFLSELSRTPLKLKYSDLIGTALKQNSQFCCNGILQAAIKGQKTDYLRNWSANSYLRWAHALGFIEYDRMLIVFRSPNSGYSTRKHKRVHLTRKKFSPKLFSHTHLQCRC
jgi:hypothetical protein